MLIYHFTNQNLHMKSILIITLLLIGMIGWGQEAKLNSWYEYSYFWNDTANYVVYTYDSADKLKSVYYTKQVSIPRNVTYSNDTLISDFNGFGTSYYYFSDDDTIINIGNYQGNTDTSFLRIGGDNEVIESEGHSWSWENGNCIEEINWEGDTIYHHVYYSEYINPWYEENKYLRRHHTTGTYSGSYNLFRFSNTSSKGEFIVMESIGPYPTVIEHYMGDVLSGTFYFDYKYVITGTPETSNKAEIVLSIDYFDIMGKKISKPKTGFYIKCKTTNNGIISTKHYLR